MTQRAFDDICLRPLPSRFVTITLPTSYGVPIKYDNHGPLLLKGTLLLAEGKSGSGVGIGVGVFVEGIAVFT